VRDATFNLSRERTARAGIDPVGLDADERPRLPLLERRCVHRRGDLRLQPLHLCDIIPDGLGPPERIGLAEQPLDPLVLEPFLSFAFPAFGFEVGLATLLDLPGAVLERAFMGTIPFGAESNAHATHRKILNLHVKF
jgi:hypothetical protein